MIFDKTVKSEKVEIVKYIVRQHNYSRCEEAYQACIDAGLSVNRQALERFAHKLRLIDNAERKRHNLSLAPVPGSQLQATNAASGYRVNGTPQAGVLAVTQRASAKAVSAAVEPKQQFLTMEQVKQREVEITFELGELKIRESELLNELNNLSSMLDNSKFN